MLKKIQKQKYLKAEIDRSQSQWRYFLNKHLTKAVAQPEKNDIRGVFFFFIFNFRVFFWAGCVCVCVCVVAFN